MKVWNRLDIRVRHFVPAGSTGRRVRTRKRRTLIMVSFAEQPVAQTLVDGNYDTGHAAAHFQTYAATYEKYEGWTIAQALRLVPDLGQVVLSDPAGFGVVLDPRTFRPMREVA